MATQPCEDCGGAGILLDFDTSTYDMCSCVCGAMRKAHMASVKVVKVLPRTAKADQGPKGEDPQG